MACRYCRGEVYLTDSRSGRYSNKGEFTHGIRVDICDGELGIEAVADTYEPNYQEESIEINYCPMCGEKLREE